MLSQSDVALDNDTRRRQLAPFVLSGVVEDLKSVAGAERQRERCECFDIAIDNRLSKEQM